MSYAASRRRSIPLLLSLDTSAAYEPLSFRLFLPFLDTFKHELFIDANVGDH